MSSLSFSSLPPSFASFPDLDSGSSLRSPGPSSSTEGRELGDKHKHRKRKRTRPDNDSGHGMAKNKKAHAEAIDLPPSAYSDRKGDRFNVHYGGLHGRDVPKYHLVGRMSFFEVLRDL